MITIKEQAVTFNQYRHTIDDPEVHIFVSGFEPTYNTITCVKGEPGTMTELMGKLENLLGVKITWERDECKGTDRRKL